jgi:hypothetical protein
VIITSIKKGTALSSLLFFILAAAACGTGRIAIFTPVSSGDTNLKLVSTAFNSGTIDTSTSANVGMFSSIAIDPDDNYPAVAYYDYTNGNLMYAKWDGSDWDDKTTVDSSGDVGQYASLTFDTSGNPSIGYYDYTNKALKWAFDDDDDGNWSENGWPMTLADNANDDFGEYCSHDISGTRYFGFAFYKANTQDLLYYEYDIVTSYTTGVDVETTNDVGTYCSLKFFSGTPKISYYDATNGDLRFASKLYPHWSIALVDSTGNVGQFTSLDSDGSGNASIAYYDVTNTNPKWARWNSTMGRWDVTTLVTSDDDLGQYISHMWYGSSKCGFAFLADDGASSTLEFVRWTSGGQDEYTADSTTDCGDYSSFAWITGGLYAGDGWVSHYCPHNINDKYLRYTRIDD